MHTAALGPGARIVFADRADGTSRPPYDRGNLADHVGDAPQDVARNRALVAAAAGVAADRLVAMSAVHGAEVAVVGAADSARPPAVDVMLSTEPGCALLVLAAHCVPVLLADGGAGVIGVVHAGWRGVRADATGAGLRAMAELERAGSTPSSGRRSAAAAMPSTRSGTTPSSGRARGSRPCERGEGPVSTCGLRCSRAWRAPAQRCRCSAPARTSRRNGSRTAGTGAPAATAAPSSSRPPG